MEKGRIWRRFCRGLPGGVELAFLKRQQRKERRKTAHCYNTMTLAVSWTAADGLTRMYDSREE
jgi:hypothetical protein